MADTHHREMRFSYKGKTIYSSRFDPKTGTIVRTVWVPGRTRNGFEEDPPWYHDKEFDKKYGWRREAFSPVPETVDISITDKCAFGCPYCYQDSRPLRDHSPKDLVETMIRGFDEPPYQIAIGGGEPTLHPNLPYILGAARQLGTVPNYTTSGDKLRDEVIDATNDFCGGIAMTFHAFKGIEWFESHYTELRRRLKVPINVHLIADKDAAMNLHALVRLQDKVGPIRLVLLAYYPDVGRASLHGLITKRTYQREFPDAIKAALSTKMEVSFSEGLLPYFLSRPELGINTDFAMRSEGRFSCYFNPKGQISKSSFHQFFREDETVYNKRAQEMWNHLGWSSGPHGNECGGCQFESKCSTPHDFHYLMCAFAGHNKVPLKE